MKEADIRPADVFQEYLRLCAQDIDTYFSCVPREEIGCPACDGASDFAFSKEGFDYAECNECSTLFVNPRPPAEAFSRYYREAPSVEYWATTFYRETADARREKLWQPKARLVHDLMNTYGATGHSVVDVGGGYGLFAEEIQRISEAPVLVIEPGPSLAAVCRNKSLSVVEKFLKDVNRSELPEGGRTFTSFELFEHLHSPIAFLRSLEELMYSGDLFIFTTLSGTGVDIRALWEHSQAVSPPHHLNFLNPWSVRTLLGRTDLEVLEVTTPGKLDMDILLNQKHSIQDRFWKAFVELADEETREHWQQVITASGWSSHMMVACRRP